MLPSPQKRGPIDTPVVIKLPMLGGIKERMQMLLVTLTYGYICKCMVFLLCMVCICLTLRHFSYDSALFGLVSYNLHPRWRTSAYNLRQGIQLVKRLRLLDDRVKQKAEVPREPNSGNAPEKYHRYQQVTVWKMYLLEKTWRHFG